MAQQNILQLAGMSKCLLGGSILSATLSALLFPIPYLVAWYILQGLLGLEHTFETMTLFYVAVAAVLGRWVLQIVSILLSHIAAMQVSNLLRKRILEHLGKLPLYWHSEQSLGGLKNVFSNDVTEIDGFIAHHLPDTVSAILLPCISLACLLYVNWILGLMLICLFIVCVYIQVKTYALMGSSNIMVDYAHSLENINAASVEFVQGMPVVKLFNQSIHSFSRMKEAIESFKKVQTLGNTVFAPRGALFTSLTMMPFSLMAVAGSVLYSFDFVSIEDLVLFLLLSGITLSPLGKLFRLSYMLMEAGQSFTRIKNIFESNIEERGDMTAFSVKDTTITVHDLVVCFGDKHIIDGVSFVAKAGTSTAIIGASGAGKSTLAAALAGMEHISGGSIRIGDNKLNDFPAHELAQLVSPVFQSPHIFCGTITENIALGQSNATASVIQKAARIARCDDFINALPMGYATRIGDGGDVHLSGGEKQRIALARMVLQDAPIIILDEATAYADAESEAEIQAALAEIMQDKTILVVAHRLYTIAGADQILVMDEGKIVEQGKHEDLLAIGGKYATLWESHHTARSWSIAPGHTSSGSISPDHNTSNTQQERELC